MLVVPPKAIRQISRERGFTLKPKRNLVVRFFTSSERVRPIAPRYQKIARNVLVGTHLDRVLARRTC